MSFCCLKKTQIVEVGDKNRDISGLSVHKASEERNTCFHNGHSTLFKTASMTSSGVSPFIAS